MNVGKLKRVAIKEFKRSPAKTGFLLAMIPVALYFCVPLLLGALQKTSPAASAATAGVVKKQADFVLLASTKAVATPSRVGPSWQEVAWSLENDMLAVPAGILANARNPFAVIRQEKNGESLAAVDDDERVSQPETQPNPAESVERSVVASDPIRALGLRLTATMVGQRSRLATINGKTYQEGETIPVTIDSATAATALTAVSLELAHVERRFVVLKMDGHELRLQLRNEVPEGVIVVRSRPE